MKVAIIGGTSGIGLETYRLLSERGYAPIALGRNKPSENVNFHRMDVESEDSIRDFFKSNGEGLSGLVYCVGKTKLKESVEQFNTETWNKLVQVNVTGAILSLKYAYPFLKKNSGKVVIVNSIASRSSSRTSGFEYTACKAALSGLVKQFSQDWAKDGVLINSVFPSMTDTPMLRNHLAASEIKSLTEKLPLGKIASPRDVARAIEFLVSSDNKYITGSGVDVSGGQYLSG